jgi:hypothetical protein
MPTPNPVQLSQLLFRIAQLRDAAIHDTTAGNAIAPRTLHAVSDVITLGHEMNIDHLKALVADGRDLLADAEQAAEAFAQAWQTADRVAQNLTPDPVSSFIVPPSDSPQVPPASPAQAHQQNPATQQTPPKPNSAQAQGWPPPSEGGSES